MGWPQMGLQSEEKISKTLILDFIAHFCFHFKPIVQSFIKCLVTCAFMLAQNIIGKKLHSHHRVALCQSPIILYLQQDLFQFYSKILCNASVIIYENTSKNVLLKKRKCQKISYGNEN